MGAFLQILAAEADAVRKAADRQILAHVYTEPDWDSRSD